MKAIRYITAILLSIAVAACGGGGSTTPTPPVTYSISGTVTQSAGGAVVSGATITLSGASSATATTATDGTYSFTGLANGSYTVIPTLAGNALSPASSAITVSGANVTGKNFTATVAATTYSISGTVSGASGVTITLSNGAGSVVTGAGGTYTIAGLVAGSFTVTPSLSGYTFSPASISIASLAANSTANNFTATAIPVAHSISGTVSGTTGVTITVTGGTANSGATTDGSGNYTVTGLYDGSYTVTPSKTGYTFNPISTSVTMSGANVTGTNFAGTANSAVTTTASGTISGVWNEGVTITMSNGASGTTTTNASGNYSFANLPSGQSYTFTPSLQGYTYASASQTVAVPAGSAVGVPVPDMVASSAIAGYSISGTVSYAGSRTGAIAILAIPQYGCNTCSSQPGVVIAGTGAYTIRGLQPNQNYTVVAEMDALGTGNANASNPRGSTTRSMTTSDLSSVDVTIVDLAPPTPVTPTLNNVSPESGSAFVGYNAPQDASGQEIATSYNIYWSTSPTFATVAGSSNFVANGNSTTFYTLTGLANGAQLYFRMTALVGSTESAPSAIVGPKTIGATTGSNTVSGDVTFTKTAPGPMLVGAYNDSTGDVYFSLIATPVSPQHYSILGVPNGSYFNFVVIDNNGNGMVDAGDISNTGSNSPPLMVSGNTTGNMTLAAADATATIRTQLWSSDGVTGNYNLGLGFNDGVKHVVAETVVSGPNMSVPFDIVVTRGNELSANIGALTPAEGNTYKFKVTYSDATSSYVTASVTGVLTTSALAQSLSATSSLTPTFFWAAPATPPASYGYRLSLWDNAGGTNWYYPQDGSLPSGTISQVYDGSSLTTGHTYTWQVQVQDANGNQATRQAQFIAP